MNGQGWEGREMGSGATYSIQSGNRNPRGEATGGSAANENELVNRMAKEDVNWGGTSIRDAECYTPRQ